MKEGAVDPLNGWYFNAAGYLIAGSECVNVFMNATVFSRIYI